MTAPEVAALAAALHDWWQREDLHMPGLDAWHEAGGWGNDASVIIAALAAQGWRITSDSVFWDERAHEVSAQAAPDNRPTTADDWGWYRAADLREHEQAAVRAALEGLRAEVEERLRHELGFTRPLHEAIAIIDARLAALDD